MVMEYLHSYSLKQVIFDPPIKADYNLNLHQKNYVSKQLSQALNFLHLEDEPIIHRDVKPENVLFENTEEVRHVYNIKLCDMDMSRCNDMISELQMSETNLERKVQSSICPPSWCAGNRRPQKLTSVALRAPCLNYIL